ncbi:MAG: molybdenum cofactor biosynthesis protein MoaE [Pirellulales bacterium]|nr:molybdenum cofactor biosynthesis protein MoaE [Pirellulales bacterium]
MIELTHNPIDVARVLASAESRSAGAVVLFLGTTREESEGRRTASLDYECYPEMAESELSRLEKEARQRWSLIECSVVHRLGHLEIGEVSVAIAVSSAHRQPAFEAGQWIIDRIKHVVPIWKRENWADGESQWVHPGLETPPTTAGE